jgi:hypothetical protein
LLGVGLLVRALHSCVGNSHLRLRNSCLRNSCLRNSCLRGRWDGDQQRFFLTDLWLCTGRRSRRPRFRGVGQWRSNDQGIPDVADWPILAFDDKRLANVAGA